MIKENETVGISEEKLLTENMEHAIELKAKLVADLNCGNSWYDLK